jgi:superfamily II DNA or RNA helicase/very-short-patch-repair endonuclease
MHFSCVTQQSPAEQKVALFRSLFRGRDDVFARRYTNRRSGKSGYAPACSNEWVRGVCEKPRVKCAACPHRRFIPVSDEVIAWHLTGHDNQGHDFVMGIYPMMPDETCYLLALDFDGEHGLADASVARDTCRRLELPAALERSRSGLGAHLWFFFEEAVPCTLARKLGAHILTESMEKRPEIGLSSYDRMFPNQDTLPKGGFGNLIALPLQGSARKDGNTCFLNGDLEPHDDQWDFLSKMARVSRAMLDHRIRLAEERGRILNVRTADVEEEHQRSPWLISASRRMKKEPMLDPLPARLEIVLADQIFISKQELPPSLQNQIIRIAAFQNPEFYRAQAMRLPTYKIPRIISCAEIFPEHIALPRGCLDELVKLLANYKIQPDFRDHRNEGTPTEVSFAGVLRDGQKMAADALLHHDCGVLSATTAFGKTVLAAYLIATRKTNTLIIVHRRQLMEQWVERLSQFLGISPKSIGTMGGGRKKPTGNIDIALIQSLVRKGVVNELVGNYGHVIIDECHHVPAVNFELVARRAKARFVLGLSATTMRKDGHHPITFMQCGPVRFRADAKSQAEIRPFQHHVVIRPTGFVASGETEDDPRLEYARICAAICADERRNRMMCDDVIEAWKKGRTPLVLTERTTHLDFLERLLVPRLPHLARLQGGMSKKVLDEALARLKQNRCAVLATGRFIGEGFDHPPLDTLFLAMPVSWRGTIAQYAGRLHRMHEGKREVIIHDYADLDIPMMARMLDKRCRGYEDIGYSITVPASATPGWPGGVPLPVESAWKNDYAATVQRLVRDGVDESLASLFLQSTRVPDLEGEGEVRARSSTEAFLYHRLESIPETAGLFKLNQKLPIPFDQSSTMEVDFFCKKLGVVIEIDGNQHLSDPDAYRRDRKKDALLQQHGYLVLRFLAEDVSKRLDQLLNDILATLTNRSRTR